MNKQSLFVSRQELIEFAGAVHRKNICDFLKKRGIPHDLNRRQEIVVLREVIVAHLSGGKKPGIKPNDPKDSKEKTLNFDHLK